MVSICPCRIYLNSLVIEVIEVMVNSERVIVYNCYNRHALWCFAKDIYRVMANKCHKGEIGFFLDIILS